MDRHDGEFGAFGGADGFDDYAGDDGVADGAHSNPPPSVVGQDERRMQVRAYNHWASMVGDANYPAIEDLEPEDLDDFGPYSVLLDFSTGSGTPTLQFIGRQLQGECRLHDLIETLGEIPRDSLLAKVADNYKRVIAAKGPVTFEAEAQNARGATIAYRGILLPYSSDNDTIDFVFAVVNWKEVADAATADALLEEIDQAMTAPQDQVDEETARHSAEIVPFPTEPASETDEADEAEADAPADPWETDDNILEIRGAAHSDADAFDDLPAPSFGQAEEEEDTLDSYDPNSYEPAAEVPEETPVTPKRNRAVDALGNPIGGAAAEEESEEPVGGGITTAAEYGLPEWDEEEDIDEDVDDLVNPLADIDLNSRLLSLVNSSVRSKKTVDLATLSENALGKDEEDEEEERPLFKPKAPSIDTVLTVEDHDEDEDEDEAEYASYDFDAPAEDVAEPYGETEELPEAVEEIEEIEEIEASVFEAQDDAASAAEEPVALEEIAGSVLVEPVDEVQVEDAYETAEEIVDEIDDEPVAQEEEAPAETNRLGLADVAEEPEALEAESEPVAASDEDVIAEALSEAAWVEEAEEAPLELTEELMVAEEEAREEEVSEDAPIEDAVEDAVEAIAPEIAQAPEVEAEGDTAEPESLTGLLAAVRDLADAARTTQDPDRRALYEAVGKAFDISIKAVLASDSRKDGSVDIQPVDLDEQFEEMKALAQRQAG